MDKHWYTVSSIIKSSGQRYTTFFVRATDRPDAVARANQVFRELLAETFPKSITAERNFSLEVSFGSWFADKD